MVVAIHAEKAAFIREKLAHIGVGSQRIIRNHVLDGTVCHAQAVAFGHEIGTVGVIIFVSDPVDTGILKQPRNVQPDRIPINMDHVVRQFHDASGPGRFLLSVRDAAA